jgi:PAS domain S-box-containing protein
MSYRLAGDHLQKIAGHHAIISRHSKLRAAEEDAVPQSVSMQQRFSHVGWISMLAALYFAAAKLSLLLAIPPGYATAVWAPSGLALAALLLAGNRVWPGIWLGAAFANVTVQSSALAAVFIGTGNTLEAVVGASLIRHFIGVPRRFDRGEDVFKFVGLVAIASVVAATIGALSIAATGAIRWADFPAHWWTWWQGDTTGIIIVTPLILLWTDTPPQARPLSRKLEAMGFALGLALAAYVVVGTDVIAGTHGPSPLLLFLSFPFIIWAAFRFDEREVAATIAALCVIAIASTLVGQGPVSSDSINTSLMLLLSFIGIAAVTGLVLSAVVEERRRATQALRQARDGLALQVAERTRALEQTNQTLQRDIAARAKLEEEFKRSEEKFRLMVEGIRDYAIFMLDPDGTVASWNAGAEKIKGYKAEEIIGQHFSRFYPQEAIESNYPQQELQIATKHGRFEDEGWRLRKDGTAFWANVIITALRDAEGRLRGFAKVTRDMTERKRVEALEHGEREINEFLAMLAHELRNPLAPIRNALDLMRIKSADDSTQEWSRNVIDRQLTQLTRLVDDLYDVGRITSGKITLHKEPVEINAAVLRAVESVQPLADARGHALDVRLARDPLLVDGDLARLSQVVLNLLNNAIKYTPDGGRIEVEVAAEADLAMVRVKDTGIGMGADLISKVFDLFVQGERALDRAEGGLGIGLTLVKRLVALHGGDVLALSEGRGRGSEFVVRLPALARKPAKSGAASAARPREPRGHKRVLVVDDNRDSADTMTALLLAWGHEVRTLYDGQSVISIVAEYRPDVVLLDIGLPNTNGYDLARQLRQSESSRHIVLVACTGYGQDDDRRRVREAGFDHHLLKPLESEALEKIIDSVPAHAASTSGAQSDKNVAEAALNEKPGETSRPAAAGDAATAPSETTGGARRSGNGAGQMPLRILIADDSAAVRESLARLLEDMGHQVRGAHDGAEAVELAQRWRPDFVLLDIHMPKLNGLMAARTLRAQFPSNLMRLVMMSGITLDEETRAGAKAAGFDHCMDKMSALDGLKKLLKPIEA